MFAFELDQAASRLCSRIRRVHELPVEDDYSEESFPEEDRFGDERWRSQQMIAVGKMLRETRQWAKRPHREAPCPALNV